MEPKQTHRKSPTTTPQPEKTNMTIWETYTEDLGIKLLLALLFIHMIKSETRRLKN